MSRQDQNSDVSTNRAVLVPAPRNRRIGLVHALFREPAGHEAGALLLDKIASAIELLKYLMTASLGAARGNPSQTLVDRTALQRMPIMPASNARRWRWHDSPNLKSFEIIGQGQCGTVWALTGSKYVLKVPKKGKLDQLWRDSVNHRRVEVAFEQIVTQLRKDITIPQYGQWIHPENTFWDEHIRFFPTNTRKTHAFLSSRIFTLPRSMRVAIVDAFAPRGFRLCKDFFLSCQENRDCLVRLYLGRREWRSYNQDFRL